VRVLVYTANVGNYDVHATHVHQSVPCEFQVFSDPIEGLTNSKASRWYKTHPPQDFDMTIYIDASVRIKSHGFVQWCMNQGEFSVFKHPNRDCLYEEAKVCRYMRKCLEEPGLGASRALQGRRYARALRALWVWRDYRAEERARRFLKALVDRNRKVVWQGSDQYALRLLEARQETHRAAPAPSPSNMVALDSSSHTKGYEQCPALVHSHTER